MNIVMDSTQQKIYIPNSLLEMFSNKKFCFLDIETTGFSRNNDYIVLIGVLYSEGNSVIIKQYFAETLSEEHQLLASFAEFISDSDILVNYNGNTFDIPFINAKLAKYNINYKIDTDKGLDLMKIVRSNKDLLQLDNYKLKTVEKLLGISREDTITGKESIDLYNEYLLSKDETLKKVILKHNYDDIFYLPRLLKIYDLIQERNNFSINAICLENNFVASINLKDLSFQKTMMNINGYTDCINLPPQIHYGDSYTFKWEPSFCTFNLRIQLCEGELSNGNKCYYINTDEYVASLENQDNIEYNIASNIILIKDKNRLMRNNIKLLIKETLSYIFSNI